MQPSALPVTTISSPPSPKKTRRPLGEWIYNILVIYVLLVSAVFRAVGTKWGEYTYMHPDERFLLMVESDIKPIGKGVGAPPTAARLPWREAYADTFSDCEDWGGYFDTSCSPLNPGNQNYSFFVYGTFPIFLVRYLVEGIYGHSGFNEAQDIGRIVSALFDLATVLLVYLIASRLYNKKIGLLASAFYGCAVLPIQLSHFFKEDTFLNFFAALAVYFAVLVMQAKTTADRQPPTTDESLAESGQPSTANGQPSTVNDQPPADMTLEITRAIIRFLTAPTFWFSIGFGVALGLAVASKLNAAPVALVLPVAAFLRFIKLPASERKRQAIHLIAYVGIAALVSILVFRVAQPYAFTGPSFFGMKPNPQWLATIREQRAQAAGDIDVPFALQWARRTVLFSGENLVNWGLGLPLGILAFAGFLWVGWRMLASRTGEWRDHILLWGWTGAYFAWQSLQANPTMRYQLPVYPLLVIFAAWAVFQMVEGSKLKVEGSIAHNPHTDLTNRPSPEWFSQAADQIKFWAAKLSKPAGLVIGIGVLLATFLYALAFVSSVYGQDFTRVAASRWLFQNVPGPINAHIQTSEGMKNQVVAYPYDHTFRADQSYLTSFTAPASGELTEIYLHTIEDQQGAPGTKTLTVTVTSPETGDEPLATASVSGDFLEPKGPDGSGYTLTLSSPVTIVEDKNYSLRFEVQGDGALTLLGAALANEGDWDDGLPLRVDGQDGFGGVYSPGLNFNMYWDDNPEKVERFATIMDSAEYIAISSNRQWGSLTRIPERFPMTTVYYRNLLGCPAEKTIIWCYAVAEPGMFQGNLGYELAAVFQSDPAIGPIRFNSQFAEEAFTVYDAPKVLIFRKTADFDPQRVRDILGAVDFSQIVRLTPKKFASYPSDLMLPSERLTEQQAGGTWSDFFSYDSLVNRFHFLGLVVWYVFIGILGLLVYPIVRAALPGLSDRGYPLARTAGLLLLTWMVWLAGSLRLPFTRPTIVAAFTLILIAGLLLAYRQREELWQELNERGWYFLLVEGLFLAFFLADLLIRLGNPDLWHASFGGEKPMDFAYFNAVLKSTTFPPYDPWFAGGYLNYYYYGFVFAGVPVKLLGIVPAIGYNLILPTLFAMVALAAFSIGWNLMRSKTENRQPAEATGDESRTSASPHAPPPSPLAPRPSPFAPLLSREILYPLLAGLAAALLMVMLGNLGTLRMIYRGWQILGSSGADIYAEGISLLTRVGWALNGATQWISGANLPYGLGDWYWIPSRVMPGGDLAITEFPLFTFLYADPHAHLFAMPVYLLAVAWAAAIVLGRARWKSILDGALGFFLGGLVIGALYPFNLSDIYTYLPLAVVATGYAIWRYFDPGKAPWLKTWPPFSKSLIATVSGVALLVGLSLLMYRPYWQWYGPAYKAVEVWKGPITPAESYLVHWGLFLFVLVSWMLWETRNWMASTPLSSLRKLIPFREIIIGAVILLVMLILLLAIKMPDADKGQALAGLPIGRGIAVAWFAIPLAAWAGVLLLRPGMPEAKRAVLFLIGTGLVITLVVEVIVARGDIGRQNTVFKFYLQVWTLFSVSAAAALGWLFADLRTWLARYRVPWMIVLVFLFASAGLYTITATSAKIRDRMVPTAPHTLDGMAYMASATYNNRNTELDLNQDYTAIRWVQDNVKGSPVLLDGASDGIQYAWFSRFSIYTGLPTVVGWQWHQQQQRALIPSDPVSVRGREVREFYETLETSEARAFLNKYNVQYIIVGQLERGWYPGPGLDKFPSLLGVLWNEVYRDRDMIIYEVIGQ